jgi:hypothetical protein
MKQAYLDATPISSSDCNNNNRIDNKLSELGSFDIAELASIVRPRYHFSSSPSAFGYQYITSNPFENFPSVARDNVHACRFISLGNVVSKEEEKLLKNSGKNRKHIHAVGIVPLVQMSRTLLEELPPGTVSSPYGYPGTTLTSSNGTHVALSEAHSRKLIRMDNASSSGIHNTSTATEQQFRWSGRGVTNSGITLDSSNYNRKQRGAGGCERQATPDELAAQDSSAKKVDNKCLFVHGVDQDKTGGTLLNMCSLLEAFKEYGCIRIRIPKRVGGNVSSYAFAEFRTHEQAWLCLIKTNRSISIAGIPLALKWSSAGTIIPSSLSSLSDPVRNQYYPGVVLPLPPPKKRRLSENESENSDTLYCKLPTTVSCSDFESLFEIMRTIAEKCLEDAINTDAPEGAIRVLVKDEPALAVTVRYVLSSIW